MSFATRVPWRSLVVAAVALAIAAAPGASGILLFDRAAVLTGEVWRFATAHLVHLSAYHLTWDVAGLVALGLLFEREIGRSWWSLLGFAGLFVSAGVLFLAPGLETYTGLSGVLNGLWVGGALHLARVEGARSESGLRLLYLACAVAAVVKIGLESAAGTPLFTDPAALGGIPVPLAHASGALAGALWAAGPGTSDVHPDCYLGHPANESRSRGGSQPVGC